MTYIIFCNDICEGSGLSRTEAEVVVKALRAKHGHKAHIVTLREEGGR